MGRWANGWTDGGRDGWMDGWMDGRTDGQIGRWFIQIQKASGLLFFNKSLIFLKGSHG